MTNGYGFAAEPVGSADEALDTADYVSVTPSGVQVQGTTMLEASAPEEDAEYEPEQFSVTFTNSWLGNSPSQAETPLFVILWEYPTDTEYSEFGMAGRDEYEIDGKHEGTADPDDAEMQFETSMAVDWDLIATETVRAFETCDELVLHEYHEKARSIAEVVIDVFGPDRIKV